MRCGHWNNIKTIYRTDSQLTPLYLGFQRQAVSILSTQITLRLLQNMKLTRKLSLVGLLLLTTVMTTGCVGTIVGTAVDVAVEVAKVPFKIGGAVVDVATGDDDDEKKD